MQDSALVAKKHDLLATINQQLSCSLSQMVDLNGGMSSFAKELATWCYGLCLLWISIIKWWHLLIF